MNECLQGLVNSDSLQFDEETNVGSKQVLHGYMYFMISRMIVMTC